MGIRYYKLFDLLNRRGMKKTDLLEILSSKTIAKLSKGEYISGEAIEKICLFLECQPGDIMEVVETMSNVITGEDMEVANHTKDDIEMSLSRTENQINIYSITPNHNK